MGKGSTAKFRGPTRAGTRDTPAELRETLAAYVQNSRLLDGLPPAERERRRQQIAGFQARSEMRSRAAKAGHVTRRALEAQRLIDRLCDPDAPEGDEYNRYLDEVWSGFTDRQRGLVEDWLAAHPNWPAVRHGDA